MSEHLGRSGGRIEHTYLWCPSCGKELTFAYSTCGGDDDLCDCDEAYDCTSCGRLWMVACGAHIGEQWNERLTISRDVAKDLNFDDGQGYRD